MQIYWQTKRITAGIGYAITGILIGALCSFVWADQIKDSNRTAKVSRALFTTAVVDREPVDRVLVLDGSIDQVYFFTELRYMDGQIVRHRWEYQGKTVYTKIFKVKGPRWRVYSSHKIKPEQLGKWTAVVTTNKGWPLKASIFEYVSQPESGANASVVVPVK